MDCIHFRYLNIASYDYGVDEFPFFTAAYEYVATEMKDQFATSSSEEESLDDEAKEQVRMRRRC